MEKVTERRSFILWFGLTAAALSVALGSMISKTTRLIFSGLMDGSFNAGYPDHYQTGKVDGRWQKLHGVWLVRSFDGLFALAAESSFGCKPHWIENQQKFYCDCHKKSYYKSGISFEGAAGKSLQRVKITRGPDGQVLVDPGKKFLLEKGEWQQPLSLLPV